METYQGPITISFADIPPVQLLSIKPDGQPGFLERLALATSRRRFTLRESWQVELAEVDYHPALNGSVEIPQKNRKGATIEFDGASIPFPWLVSFLTIGILRPLGVMLIASIVHDYIYRTGSLRVCHDGATFSDVAVERHIADRLFRDIIQTVNGMPLVAYIGWFFVRLGWPVIRFNGNRRGGKAPVLEYVLFIVVLGLLSYLVVSGQLTVSGVLLGLTYSYLAFYLLTYAVNRLKG